MSTYFDNINSDIFNLILSQLDPKDILNTENITTLNIYYKILLTTKYLKYSTHLGDMPEDIYPKIFTKEYIKECNDNIWKCLFKYYTLYMDDKNNYIEFIYLLHKYDSELLNLLMKSKLILNDNIRDIEIDRVLSIIKKNYHPHIFNMVYKDYLIDYKLIRDLFIWQDGGVDTSDTNSKYENNNIPYLIQLIFLDNFKDIFDYIRKREYILDREMKSEFLGIVHNIITLTDDRKVLDKIDENIIYIMKKDADFLHGGYDYSLVEVFFNAKRENLFEYFVKYELFELPDTQHEIDDIIIQLKDTIEKTKDPHQYDMFEYLMKEVMNNLIDNPTESSS